MNVLMNCRRLQPVVSERKEQGLSQTYKKLNFPAALPKLLTLKRLRNKFKYQKFGSSRRNVFRVKYRLKPAAIHQALLLVHYQKLYEIRRSAGGGIDVNFNGELR
jgi:hypothetical protein